MEVSSGEHIADVFYRARKLAFRTGNDVAFVFNGEQQVETFEHAQRYLRDQMQDQIQVGHNSMKNMEAALEERKAYILKEKAEFKELFDEEANIPQADANTE